MGHDLPSLKSKENTNQNGPQKAGTNLAQDLRKIPIETSLGGVEPTEPKKMVGLERMIQPSLKSKENTH
jgi:hypothetical protein